MLAFIELPHGWRRWRERGMESIVHLALEPLHCRGADCQLLAILHIPHHALWPQVRPQCEDIPGTLDDLLWYASRRP